MLAQQICQSSGRAEVELAGIGFGIGNELRDRLGWKLWATTITSGV
jgi:hypothetical protein